MADDPYAAFSSITPAPAPTRSGSAQPDFSAQFPGEGAPLTVGGRQQSAPLPPSPPASTGQSPVVQPPVAQSQAPATASAPTDPYAAFSSITPTQSARAADVGGALPPSANVNPTPPGTPVSGAPPVDNSGWNGTLRNVLKWAAPEAAKLEAQAPAVEAGGRGAMQGASFGLEPAAYGVLSGLSSLWGGPDETFGGNYESRRAQEVAANALAQKEHPTAYLTGEVGGGLATGALMPEFAPANALREASIAAQTAAAVPGAVIKGAGLLPRAAAGATDLGLQGAGFGTGGALGTGVSQEQSPADVWSGVKQGAEQGAALGVVGGAALKGAGKVANGVWDTVGNQFRPSGSAVGKFSEALARSGVTTADLAAKVEAAHAAGVTDYNLSDAAYDSYNGTGGVRGIGTTVASIGALPGKAGRAANEQFAARQREAGPLAEKHIKDALGSTGSNEMDAALKAERRAATSDLYNTAHQETIDPTVAAHPDKNAQSLEGLAPELGATGAWQGGLARLRQQPSQVGLKPDFTTLDPWDYMKRDLAQKIKAESAKDIAGQKPAADADQIRTWTDLHDRLKNELEAQSDAQSKASIDAGETIPGTGSYSEANRIYADYSKQRDAIWNGKEAMNNPSITREQVADDFKKLTPEQKTAYRQGAGNALGEQVSKTTDKTKLDSDFYSKNQVADKLKTITPPRELDTLKQRMSEAAAMGRTNATGIREEGAQQTNAQQFAEAVHAHFIGGAAMMGNVHGLMYWVARIAPKMAPENRDGFKIAMQKLILDPNPAAIKATLAKIDKLNAPAASKAKLVRAVANLRGQWDAQQAAQKSAPPAPSMAVPMDVSRQAGPARNYVFPKGPAYGAPPPGIAGGLSPVLRDGEQWWPIRRAGVTGPSTHLHNPRTSEIRLIDDRQVQ